jgi:hypothetical protein
MPENLKLVLIEWLDSHASRGWQDLKEIQQAAEPLYCRSVGWLIHDDKRVKSIVPHLAGEQNGDILLHGCGNITIPTKSVVKMTILKDR